MSCSTADNTADIRLLYRYLDFFMIWMFFFNAMVWNVKITWETQSVAHVSTGPQDHDFLHTAPPSAQLHLCAVFWRQKPLVSFISNSMHDIWSCHISEETSSPELYWDRLNLCMYFWKSIYSYFCLSFATSLSTELRLFQVVVFSAGAEFRLGTVNFVTLISWRHSRELGQNVICVRLYIDLLTKYQIIKIYLTVCTSVFLENISQASLH